MKTRAAILYALNSPLIVEDIEIPLLKKGQVLVKILYSGICRAQYNEIIGLKGPDKFLPHCLGHEASAVIVDTGPGITKVKKGDYVVLSWIKGNGLDAFSTLYKCGTKVINAGAVTTFSDYSVVSENRVTKIPRKVPADRAAILGCAIATGGGIINNSLQAGKGSSIVIFGAGGIGLSAILMARAKGCAPIIAVDVQPQKLEFARKLGATDCILADTPDVFARIRKVVPDGPDYAVDASGAKSAMETAFAVIKPKGKFVIAGNLSKDEKISLHPFELIKGKQISGTWGGETVPQKDIPQYARDYLKGKLPLDEMITHRFSLEEINRAFETLTRAEAGRIIIRCCGDPE